MKKLFFLWLITLPLSLWSILYAQEVDNKFAIIPELTGLDKANEAIQAVWKTGGEVMENYQKEYQKISGDLATQMATGIMDRKTLLDYVVYIVRFLSQIGLVIGALMIIYAGYLYASNVFTGSGVNEGKKAVQYAVIGVFVIVFAYAIMKLFTSLFFGT